MICLKLFLTFFEIGSSVKITPSARTSPDAALKGMGMRERILSTTLSASIPSMPPVSPHIPTSEI